MNNYIVVLLQTIINVILIIRITCIEIKIRKLNEKD